MTLNGFCAIYEWLFFVELYPTYTYSSVQACTGKSHFTQFLYVQFCFNMMLHTQSVAALIFWRRLAESGVPVTLSVMYMN